MPSDQELLLEPDTRIPDIREPIFRDVIAVHNAEVKFNTERKVAGWWVGGIGAAVGVLGVLSAAVVAISHQPQVRYTTINEDTGIISESFGAKDAPKHYSEHVIRHTLKDYIEHREMFVWQIDPETYHHVAMLSTVEEQARYAADRQKQNLGERYGTTGYAKVIKYRGNDSAFVRRAKAKDGALEYEVRFIKGEVMAYNPTKPVETRWTARIIFQFHPELKMSDADRLSNEAGLMVISYNAIED